MCVNALCVLSCILCSAEATARDSSAKDGWSVIDDYLLDLVQDGLADHPVSSKWINFLMERTDVLWDKGITTAAVSEVLRQTNEQSKNGGNVVVDELKLMRAAYDETTREWALHKAYLLELESAFPNTRGGKVKSVEADTFEQQIMSGIVNMLIVVG